jgi:hypothetical protein
MWTQLIENWLEKKMERCYQGKICDEYLMSRCLLS